MGIDAKMLFLVLVLSACSLRKSRDAICYSEMAYIGGPKVDSVLIVRTDYVSFGPYLFRTQYLTKSVQLPQTLQANGRLLVKIDEIKSTSSKVPTIDYDTAKIEVVDCKSRLAYELTLFDTSTSFKNIGQFRSNSLLSLSEINVSKDRLLKLRDTVLGFESYLYEATNIRSRSKSDSISSLVWFVRRGGFNNVFRLEDSVVAFSNKGIHLAGVLYKDHGKNFLAFRRLYNFRNADEKMLLQCKLIVEKLEHTNSIR